MHRTARSPSYSRWPLPAPTLARRAVAFAFGVAGGLFMLARPGQAISPGLTGYSGKQAGWGCEFCHSGGGAPQVRFEGPQEVTAGAVAPFRFVVQSQASEQLFAGLNVAASAGLLDVLPGEGARVEVGEIAHDAPKHASGGETSWGFTWRAPAQPGHRTFYGAGVGSNGNHNKNGDGVAATTFDVTVVAKPQLGDANCDGRLSAADLAGLLMLLASRDPGVCGFADANNDGGVDESDIDAVTAALFARFQNPIVFNGETNRLNAYAADGRPSLPKQTVIENASLDPNGRDINGQVCFAPDGSRRFIAGEDTHQPNPPPGWGYFQLRGNQVGELTASQIGKLVPTYQTAIDNAENYGCGFLSDGRLVTTDIGNQASGPASGQLILWFPPFDAAQPRFCKLDIAIGTAGGIFVDDEDRIYVASARLSPGVFRYTGPFPTSDTAAGGCGLIDGSGAPLAGQMTKEKFIGADTHLVTPTAVVGSARRTFYVSSVLNGVIAEYDASGRFVRRILDPPAGQGLPISTGHPMGLGVDSSGTVYYADIGLVIGEGGIGPGPSTGTVRRIRFRNGQPLPPETLDAGLNFPDGIGVVEN